jgi:hypothetical protein
VRYQYRVTKYDPALRDFSGAYVADDWTSHSDVGREFNSVTLSESEYLRVEEAYVQAIEALLSDAKIKTLELRGLEGCTSIALPDFAKPGAVLSVAQCSEFARLALREVVWGKLVVPGRAYVHFGYDFYMYIGLPVRCQSAITAVQNLGLFVEAFRSPYLRQRPNPSVKGTATSGLRPLASAPYVER